MRYFMQIASTAQQFTRQNVQTAVSGLVRRLEVLTVCMLHEIYSIRT